MLAVQTHTTKGPVMADMTSKTPPGALSAADVAELLTEQARLIYDRRVAERERVNAARRERGRVLLPPIPEFRPIKAITVLQSLRDSRPGTTASGRERRYAQHPMPEPAGRFGLMPWWHESQKPDLIKWFTGRPGRGHGTGGWPAGRRRGSKS